MDLPDSVRPRAASQPRKLPRLRSAPSFDNSGYLGMHPHGLLPGQDVLARRPPLPGLAMASTDEDYVDMAQADTGQAGQAVDTVDDDYVDMTQSESMQNLTPSPKPFLSTKAAESFDDDYVSMFPAESSQTEPHQPPLSEMPAECCDDDDDYINMAADYVWLTNLLTLTSIPKSYSLAFHCLRLLSPLRKSQDFTFDMIMNCTSSRVIPEVTQIWYLSKILWFQHNVQFLWVLAGRLLKREIPVETSEIKICVLVLRERFSTIKPHTVVEMSSFYVHIVQSQDLLRALGRTKAVPCCCIHPTFQSITARD